MTTHPCFAKETNPADIRLFIALIVTAGVLGGLLGATFSSTIVSVMGG